MFEATSASAAIDLYVARENPALVLVMDALRALVKKTVPVAREAMNPWGVPIFEWNGALCYLRVGKKHVTFGFPRGASMKDAGKLLEGEGNNLRHVKIKDVAEIRNPHLKALLLEAKSLNDKTPVARNLRPADQLRKKSPAKKISSARQRAWENLE
jgi:hypothetical protein